MSYKRIAIRLLLICGAVVWGVLGFALIRAALIPRCLGIAAAPGHPGGIICDSFWTHGTIPLAAGIALYVLAAGHLFLAFRPRGSGA